MTSEVTREDIAQVYDALAERERRDLADLEAGWDDDGAHAARAEMYAARAEFYRETERTMYEHSRDLQEHITQTRAANMKAEAAQPYRKNRK